MVTVFFFQSDLMMLLNNVLFLFDANDKSQVSCCVCPFKSSQLHRKEIISVVTDLLA